MQKPELAYSIALQNTYTSIECALFKDAVCIDKIIEPKALASSNGILMIATLLERYNLTFSSLSFLTINQGPAPLTTLRVTLAFANGLGFSQTLPLVGIDGLDALLHEHQSHEDTITIALLNAFNNDVYIGIMENGEVTYKGYGPIKEILTLIANRYDSRSVRLMGNALLLHTEIIQEIGEGKWKHTDNIEFCSIQYIGAMGYKQWQSTKSYVYSLLPLYVKLYTPA